MNEDGKTTSARARTRTMSVWGTAVFGVLMTCYFVLGIVEDTKGLLSGTPGSSDIYEFKSRVSAWVIAYIILRSLRNARVPCGDTLCVNCDYPVNKLDSERPQTAASRLCSECGMDLSLNGAVVRSCRISQQSMTNIWISAWVLWFVSTAVWLFGWIV